MNVTAWSRLDGWAGESIATKEPKNPKMTIGSFDGDAVATDAETIRRIARYEQFASMGKLDSQHWIGTKELLALVKEANNS